MKAKSKNQTSTAAKKSSTGKPHNQTSTTASVAAASSSTAKPHNQTSTAASVAAASSPDAHTAISAFKRQLAPTRHGRNEGCDHNGAENV